MIAITFRAARAFAAAGLAAGLLSSMIWIPSNAAEKTPSAPASVHDEIGQGLDQHLQRHLDALAGRLEIKASQEPAWQAFSAAYRDVVHAGLAQREAARADAADADAASLARKYADGAAEHAQKLARLADATAKLEQSLGADQRLVFNEVARHFAQEHFAHGPMQARGYERHHGACRGAERHGRWEQPSRPNGGAMGGDERDAPDGAGEAPSRSARADH